ncbi:MAG: FAD-dependent oxidoreductase [Eubacteriaceae bacterium]|nr:FAD-dependent oxidoreductase [Eubacteriaceae bacterium]
MYDIIVIGGGPAGMTAALYALRNGKSVLVIEKNGFGGQITYSPRVENYPGISQMSGNQFADAMMDQILSHGAEVELAEAVGIACGGDVRTVATDDGKSYEARAVIIATGVKHRMLGLENEHALVGDGISFCAVCDGDFYAGADVLVAGGGNSALQEAILLSAKAKTVTVIQDLDFLTGEKALQDVLLSRDNVRCFTGMKITSLMCENGCFRGLRAMKNATGEEMTFSADGLFEAIGLIPENGAFSGVASLNAYGYFDSGEDALTKTPGVFVAGDCRAKSVRQLTTAVGDGAAAAVAATAYIDSLGK